MSTVFAAELSAIVRSAPSVPASLTCRETMRVMFQHPEARCIVVCNKRNEPIGMLMCDRFFLAATGRMGMDHFYRESVTRLMNRKPLIADIASSAESLWTAAMNRADAHKADCIILTREGKYAGVIHTSDLTG